MLLPATFWCVSPPYSDFSILLWGTTNPIHDKRAPEIIFSSKKGYLFEKKAASITNVFAFWIQHFLKIDAEKKFGAIGFNLPPLYLESENLDFGP